MHTTRREAFKLAGTGAMVLAGVGNGTAALAQAAVPVPIDYGNASSAESELRIVNFDLLETDAKKILPPGRFAFMGPPATVGLTARTAAPSTTFQSCHGGCKG